MDNNSLENSLYQRIVMEYLDCDSIEQTAKVCGTSKVTVRRVLITEGLWCSKTSIEVGKLHDEGLSVAEIAEKLVVTENAVKAYLPYTKGMYGEELTEGAERVKRYRERKETVAAKMQDMSGEEEMYILTDWHPVSDTPVEEENWEDKQKRWEEEHSKRLEAECNETRRKTEELWKTLRPEPIKLEYAPPHLLRLHIELLGFSSSMNNVKPSGKLLKAAKAERGISRDIIVPADMTLHALHYAIQRLFGFLGYHLNNFSLSEDDFNLVTAARFGGYADLCGTLFRFSDQFEGDAGWDNDYDGQSSVNTWIKKMYRAPYYKGNLGDTWYANRRSVLYLRDKYPEIKDETLLLEADEILNPGRNRNFLREDVTVGELLTSTGKMKTDIGELDFFKDRTEAVKTWKADIIGKFDWCSRLLEAAEIGSVFEDEVDEAVLENGLIKTLDKYCASLNSLRLGYEGDAIVDSLSLQNYIFVMLGVHPMPFFREIYYNYDYGDNWRFKISAVEEYRMMNELTPGDDRFAEEDLMYAYDTRDVQLKRAAVKRLRYEDSTGAGVGEELRGKLAECHVYGRPFCITADGLNLVEDVGGAEGFKKFILSVNGKPETDEQKEERKENLLWAKELGWTGRKSSPEHML